MHQQLAALLCLTQLGVARAHVEVGWAASQEWADALTPRRLSEGNSDTSPSCDKEAMETKLMREAREQGIEFYSDEDEKAVLPAPADISDQVLVSIVKQQLPDDQVNALVWKYLGYKKSADGSWDNSAVFPKWRERFPLPPDLIGHDDKASYNQEDGSIKAAVQALQQSVPKEHKQRLKPTLTPLGWSGFVMEGLTPNMTRRAQCASWLLYYRTVLHGVSIDELIRRKKKRQAWEANLKDANQGSPASGTSQQAVFRRLAEAGREVGREVGGGGGGRGGGAADPLGCHCSLLWRARVLSAGLSRVVRDGGDGGRGCVGGRVEASSRLLVDRAAAPLAAADGRVHRRALAQPRQ